MPYIVHRIILAMMNGVALLISTHLFFSAFGKRNGRKYIWNALVALMFFFISQLAVGETLLKPVILCVGVFMITLLYNMKTYMRILVVFLFMALMSTIELVAGIAIMHAFRIPLTQAQHGMFDYVGVLLTQTLNIYACYIIRNAKHKKLFGAFRKKYLAVYLLPLATGFVVWFEYFVMLHLDRFDLQIVGFFSLLLLVGANILIFYLIDDMQKSVENENRLLMAEELNKRQTEQYTSMLEQNYEIRQMRHDQKHFLMGALSELNDGNVENLKDALEEQLAYITNSGADSICGISSVDAVMHQKSLQAMEKGIKIAFTHKNLKEVKLSGIDLAILLGNALDNAIEATEKLNDKQLKTVEVYLVYDAPMLLLIVTNNVAEDVDITDLKTTKADKKMHGFGISAMESVARKYDGDVSFSCENKKFKAIISLYDKE